MKSVLTHCGMLACLLVAASSCDLIDYHPYDTRYSGPRQLNAKAISAIEEKCDGRDSLCFAVISDTQRWYDETAAAVRSINAQGNVDFVIHCGDMTDFGLTREFEWMQRELDRLDMPCVCLIGNHDCLGTGSDMYHTIYGEPNFSFTAGDTHFVCLNTNAFEYDYSIAIPDFTYIKEDQQGLPAEVRRSVAVMHAAPLTDQFPNNVAEIFNEKLRLYPDIEFCLCGHNHSFDAYEPLNDGLIYYRCAAAEKREYLLFTLKANGNYTYEVVHY